MEDYGSTMLLSDWYNRFVKKPMLDRPPSFNTGMPASPTPTPSAPVTSPTSSMDSMGASPSPSPAPASFLSNVPALVSSASAISNAFRKPSVDAAPGADTMSNMSSHATPDAAAPGGSWSDRLTEGLKDPAKLGLLGAGLSMLATPPREVPYSAGEVIGNAGLAGIGIFEKALSAKRQDEMMRHKEEEYKQILQERADWHKADIENKQERTKIEAKKEETQRIVRMANAERARAQAGNAADLGKMIPQEYADAIGMPEVAGMTWGQFGKSQAATTAVIKPAPFKYSTDDKGDVHVMQGDEEIRVIPGAGRTGGGGAGGAGKPGNLSLFTKELVSYYLPRARAEISKKAPPGSERMQQLMESLNVQDPTTGAPSAPKVREHLGPEEQKEFDFINQKGQEYSKTMVPAAAFQKAKEDWDKEHPAPKTDARYEEYRRVYEEIRNYSGWSNAEKNAKINELNAKARQMGVIK